MEEDDKNKKRAIFLILLLLILIGFFLRVLPFSYGAFITFSDTQAFSQALELGKMLAQQNFHYLKEPAIYPYFLSYIFLFFFGIFYLIGLTGGLFSSSAEFTKYVILQMDQLFEISRIIIVISGTLIVFFVYLITRRLISERMDYKKNIWALISCFLATILITFSLLHIHFSKVIRSHIPVSLFFLLTFYFYLVLLKKNNFLSYVALGLTAGITAGILQNGLIAILFLFLAHFFLTYRKIKQTSTLNKLKEIFSIKFIISLIAFFLIVAISYPYILLSPKSSLNLDQGRFNLTLSGDKIVDRGDDLTSFHGKGFITELKGLFFYEPGLIIILFFLLGLALGLRQTKTTSNYIENKSWYYTSGITGAIIFIVLYLLFFGIYDHMRYRMLAPIIPFLCILVGIIGFIVLNKTSKKYRYWIICFLILILIVPITQSIRLISLTMKDSTQDLAGKWILSNIAPNEMIAIESHARLKLIPSQQSLKRRVNLTDLDSIGQKNKFLINLNQEDYPENAMTIMPLFIFKDDYDKIRNFLETETDYLVLGYYTPKAESEISQVSAYQISLSLDKELIQEFSPFKDNPPERMSIFPQEMENPIIDLWTYKKMGPLIEIYKIKK